MKLNRRRLRRLIKEEYSKVLDEMYMGGGASGDMYSGGHMGAASRAPSPGSDDYDRCGGAIQTSVLQCAMKGIRSSDADGVKMCCMEACQQHGVSHYLDYVCEKVMNLMQMSGM